ncbi:MAG: PhoU domain-containing protein [Archaeoglobaceae archaeon]
MKLIEDEIRRISEEVLVLHELAKKAVELCFKSHKNDRTLVREISALEERSDELEARIHDECSHFIIRFQPMAKDMRFALGMIRISSAYERIVDLAQEISLYECELREKIFEAEKALLEMFDVVKEGFSNIENLKDRMISLDDKVDDLYIQLLEDIEKNFRCVEEVLAVRHLERIGDLLCKIATRLVYVQEGKWTWIK